MLGEHKDRCLIDQDSDMESVAGSIINVSKFAEDDLNATTLCKL